MFRMFFRQRFFNVRKYTNTGKINNTGIVNNDFKDIIINHMITPKLIPLGIILGGIFAYTEIKEYQSKNNGDNPQNYKYIYIEKLFCGALAGLSFTILCTFALFILTQSLITNNSCKTVKNK